MATTHNREDLYARLNALAERNPQAVRRFAVWCARQALVHTTDPRVAACVETTERYLRGEATQAELDAACAVWAAADAADAAVDAADAARAAAWAAADADEAAWAAAYAAWAAWAAAWAAADAADAARAAREATHNAQLAKLSELEGNDNVRRS